MTNEARPLFRLADDLTVLTRSFHQAAARRRADFEPLPPDGQLGGLMELRTALLVGVVSLDGARAVYRYDPSATSAWSASEAAGWISLDAESIRAKPPATELCRRILRVHDEVATEAWGTPTGLLELATAVVNDADDVGPAFRTWRGAGWEGASTDAGRLFLALTTLRYLRADAYAAAWQAAGHTAASVGALDPSSGEWNDIETDTDLRNAAALSGVPPTNLAELITAVAGLAAQPWSIS